MSRLLVRCAISNLGRLTNSGASASLKSKRILRVACQGVMRCDSRLMSSMNKSCGAASNMPNKEFVARLEEAVLECQDMLELVGSKIGYFEVASIKDPYVELKAKYLDEEIKIMFNVNDFFPNQEDLKEISRLNLTVEINRNKGKKLLVMCYFEGLKNLEHLDENIKMKKIAVVESGKEFTNTTFKCKDNLIDENIKEYLRNLLEKRGIDLELLIKLEDWTLNYDRNRNVKVLSGLKDFVSA